MAGPTGVTAGRAGRGASRAAAWALAVLVAAVAGCDDGTAPETVESPPVVFFDMVHEGQRDIFRVRLDGSGLTRVTSDPGADVAPTAVGDRVVFTSYRDGRAQLYSVGADGGPVSRVVDVAANLTDPSLSPDGQALAFASDVDGAPKLWTSDEDGTSRRRATEGFGHGGSLEFSPDWSPTGSHIAFVSTHDGSSDVYVGDVAAGTFTSLVSAPGAQLQPAWSPDGSRLAYTSSESGTTAVYVTPVPAGQRQRISPDGVTAVEPAWTPGDTILYVSYDDQGATRLEWVVASEPDQRTVIPLPAGGDPRRPAVRR